MNKLIRSSATIVSTLALVAGFTSMAAGASSIHDSGRDSDNRIDTRNSVEHSVSNDTEIDIRNDNPQDARTGDSRVEDNDDVDDVTTGDARNDSLSDFEVDVDNSSSSEAAFDGGFGGGFWNGGHDDSIRDSGRHSDNFISRENEVDVEVENDTNISITNDNEQDARSGDARVEDNDDVGSVSTGDATNISTHTFSVSVRN